ncbi:MAG: DUF4870 domain-containing protein [Acidimicrobiia bacterium]|nr:DUF4870 domain-containing protein [Acidimicrobiia bacterium]
MSESEPWSGQQQPAEQAAPGWYPTGEGWQRYWDGQRWTEHQAPLAPQPYQGGAIANDTGTAVLIHIGGAIVGFLLPLVIYLIKKDESPFLRHHAAEALNFHFTVFLATIVCLILFLVIIGIFLFLALIVAAWVLTIIAAIAASRGEYYRYPFTIRVVS